MSAGVSRDKVASVVAQLERSGGMVSEGLTVQVIGIGQYMRGLSVRGTDRVCRVVGR